MYGGYDALSRRRADGPQAIQQPLAAEQQLQLQQHPQLQHRVATRDYTDPTNYEFTDGQDSSGLNGARWLGEDCRACTRCRGPCRSSAFYNLREGLQFNRTIQSPNRTGAGGTVNALIEPQGTRHYPMHKQLDINVGQDA